MSNQVKTIRTKQKLSLRQLAHFVGISHTTLLRLENGDPSPVTAVMKIKIAKELGVTLTDAFPK